MAVFPSSDPPERPYDSGTPNPATFDGQDRLNTPVQQPIVPPSATWAASTPPRLSSIPVPHVSVTAGFNDAWLRVRENLGILALVGVTVVGGALLLAALFGTLIAASNSSAAEFFATFMLVAGLLLYGVIAQASIFHGLLKMVDGVQVQYADFFKFKNLGPVIVAGLIVSTASAVLMFTFVAPLVLGFLTLFTTLLIIDRGYGAWDAITGSAQLVWNNIPTVATFVVGSAIAGYVGAMFFGVGIFVAIAVILVAHVWLYKKLLNSQEKDDLPVAR